jgi:hypothetical protein
MAHIPRVPFHFHAEGHALSGQIHEPVWYPIPAKASTSLPTIGGQAEAIHEEFRAHEFIYFKRAHTHVAGRRTGPKVYVTHATTTIEGLNIENVLTADRITCRLRSIHNRKHPEGLILTYGSEFENFRIKGHKLEVTLRHRIMKDFDTLAMLAGQIKKQKRPGTIVKRGGLVFSLVEKIETDLLYVPKDGGNSFVVPDFGKVTIAEVFAEVGTRTLTMLHLELGSPQTTNSTIGETRINGKPYPPF